MTFSDIEYGKRKYPTRRDLFLGKMDEMIPWEEWMAKIRPLCRKKSRGRPATEPEVMLRMLLLQDWYGMSGAACEEAVMDSYAMRTFVGIDFINETVPDATTLYRFRRKLLKNGIWDTLRDDLDARLIGAGLRLRHGKGEEALLVRGRPQSGKKTDQGGMTAPDIK